MVNYIWRSKAMAVMFTHLNMIEDVGGQYNGWKWYLHIYTLLHIYLELLVVLCFVLFPSCLILERERAVGRRGQNEWYFTLTLIPLSHYDKIKVFPFVMARGQVTCILSLQGFIWIMQAEYFYEYTYLGVSEFLFNCRPTIRISLCSH